VQVGGDESLQASIAIDVPPRLRGTARATDARQRGPRIPLGSLSRSGSQAPKAAVEPAPPPRDDDSVFASPWLWVGVGVVAIGAGVTVALLVADEDAMPVRGDTEPPVIRGKVALLETR
jgi:hypothetical protein